MQDNKLRVCMNELGAAVRTLNDKHDVVKLTIRVSTAHKNKEGARLNLYIPITDKELEMNEDLTKLVRAKLQDAEHEIAQALEEDKHDF